MLEADYNLPYASHRSMYRRRCEVMCNALTQHLEGLATWVVPRAGMFVWLDLLGEWPSFCYCYTVLLFYTKCRRGRWVVPRAGMFVWLDLLGEKEPDIARYNR